MTGGGSGGHITPILAVARELKQLQPDTQIVYVGQRGDGLADVPAQDEHIDAVYTVLAGKFRRYHGEGFKQLLDLPTVLKNIRDAFFVLAGIWQSFWLLRRLKPQIILTRGAYVSVPVALGGVLNRVPYITHDSDAIPSLANRLIAPWAVLHAVALPEELYAYPIDKTVTVGVPVSQDYQPVTSGLQRRYRQELGLERYEYLVLVTGGGNGARSLNAAVVASAGYLLKRYPGLVVVHVAGRALEDEVAAAYNAMLPAATRPRVLVKGFVTDLYRYSGAADVIIARGGATNLAEFALQAKACIIVPNPFLTGGHQLKNAEALTRQGAVIELTEEQIEQERRLGSVLSDLLDNPGKRLELSRQLANFARPDAARRLAMLLLEKAKLSK